VDCSWDAASSGLGSFQLPAGTNNNNPNIVLSGIFMIGLQSASCMMLSTLGLLVSCTVELRLQSENKKRLMGGFHANHYSSSGVGSAHNNSCSSTGWRAESAGSFNHRH